MAKPRSFLGFLAGRLRWVLLAQVLTLVVSTAGFVVLAGLDWFDALYMSVITLGTVGYGEVAPLDTIGRTWAMVVITGGFAVLVYAGAVLTSLLLSGDLRTAFLTQKGERMRKGLHNHVIVVGFGRVGRSVVLATLRSGHECLVVDADPAKAEAIRADGALAVVGDGMQEDILREAGIETARALVAAGPDDPANLVVTLTARALRPDLRIISRVNEVEWQQRMTHAGATAAMSPYGDFGAGLAASALGKDVVETHVLSGYGLRSEDIIVGSGSRVIGRNPSDLAREHDDVTILALRRTRSDDPWQPVEAEIREGDVLLLMGSDENVASIGARLRV